MPRKQLKDDYSTACKQFPAESYIKALVYDPDSVTFNFEGSGHCVSFTLSIADEYPEGSMLFPSDGDPRDISVSLPRLLAGLSTEYCKKFGITLGPESTLLAAAELFSAKPVKKLAVSIDPESDEEMEDIIVFSPKLTADIEEVRKIHGVGAVTTKEFAHLDMLNVELQVGTGSLDTVTQSAWGLLPHVPITIRLTIAPSVYVFSVTPPQIEVTQHNEKFGLSTQLTQIINAFCKQYWETYAEKNTAALRLAQNTVKNVDVSKTKQPAFSITGKKEGGDDLDLEELERSGAINFTASDVARLMGMGFSRNMAINALNVSEGSLDDATHLLLEDSSVYTHKPAIQQKESWFKFGMNKKTKTSDNIPSLSKSKLHLESSILQQEEEDLKIKEYVFDYNDGFLLQLYKYVEFRLPNLNKFCVICDGSHLFAGGSHLIKPSVCARDLCCYSFQTLGICSEASIATQAEVVDLLVCMAKAAADSARHELIFDPFPTLFHPKDPKRVILSAKEKDFKLLREILGCFPSIEAMTTAQQARDMKMIMEGKHEHSFSLLQWIINSNLSFIEKLPPEKHIKTMGTSFQYVLRSAPPEKESKFAELKAKHGSTFAFHGSPVENWHCILRTGLKNASGTKLQIHGAAYGSGIYLSPQAMTSFGYTAAYRQPAQQAAKTPSSSSGRFLSSTNFHCVAMAEVVNIPTLRKSGTIWVCPQEDCVMTRFFFVYPTATQAQPGSGITGDTQNKAFEMEVRAVLGQEM